MAIRYHVSEDGVIRQCTARKRECSLVHGDTPEDAATNDIGLSYTDFLEPMRKAVLDRNSEMTEERKAEITKARASFLPHVQANYDADGGITRVPLDEVNRALKQAGKDENELAFHIDAVQGHAKRLSIRKQLKEANYGSPLKKLKARALLAWDSVRHYFNGVDVSLSLNPKSYVERMPVTKEDIKHLIDNPQEPKRRKKYGKTVAVAGVALTAMVSNPALLGVAMLHYGLDDEEDKKKLEETRKRIEELEAEYAKLA